MAFHFRQAGSSDSEALRKLAISSYGQFKEVLSEKNWTILNKNLKEEDSYLHMLKIASCFVCEYEDKIIGVAYLVPSGNPTEIFDSRWCYIRMVGVDPSFRGNGIARKLTEMCIAYAKQSKEKIIALHTSEFMDAARHLYESLGFERIKELDPIFGKRYWLYQLKLA
ncbi:MAG: GNAT family N-acetyltransferase [Bacteroidia bacterium]|nr:GNAT family N-acetyltransferase [Bacteroidia bacterium]